MEEPVKQDVAAEEQVSQHDSNLEEGAQELSNAAIDDGMLKDQPQAEEVEEVASVKPEVVAPTHTEVQEGLTERQVALNRIYSAPVETEKLIIDAVKAFSEVMVPKAPMTPAICVKAQYDFLQAMVWLLRQPYEDFHAGWSALLLYFAEFHGENNNPNKYSPLSEYSTARYLDYWTKGADSCHAYALLVQLIRETRTPELRKKAVARKLTLEKFSTEYLSEAQLENLRRFYKL